MDKFNSQTFEEWRHSPLTALFLRFLKDQQSDLGRRWMEGQALGLQEQTKALLMGELADLSWADVADFYGIPVDETEGGGESSSS